jgi:hypothetical protein
MYIDICLSQILLDEWQYNFEFNKWTCIVGPHNATYTVEQTKTGLQFTKVRHAPLVKNAGGKYKKVRSRICVT